MLQENNNKTSELRLVNRNKLSLTSVEKILGTSDNRITAIVAGDTICIIGNNLKVLKIDTDTGNFEAEGQVNEIRFLTGSKGGLFKKIFKWFYFQV